MRPFSSRHVWVLQRHKQRESRQRLGQFKKKEKSRLLTSVQPVLHKARPLKDGEGTSGQLNKGLSEDRIADEPRRKPETRP